MCKRTNKKDSMMKTLTNYLIDMSQKIEDIDDIFDF